MAAIKQNIDTLVIEVIKTGGKGILLGLVSTAASLAAKLAFTLIDRLPKLLNGYSNQLDQNMR